MLSGKIRTPKEPALSDFIYYESPESGILCSDRKQISGQGGLGGIGGVGGEDYQGEEITSRVGGRS